MSDADGADGDSGGGNNVPFFYTGQDPSQIPRDVTHVIIHPSVNVIGNSAFYNCDQLVKVVLCEGLERIEAGAFQSCSSLPNIKIPSTVKVIGVQAFEDCKQLLEVVLCEGLNRIEACAFRGCSSLKHAKIPSTVKAIGQWAFCGCKQMVEVVLCEGLEQIEVCAFTGCSSLPNIKIPSTVKVIGVHAFQDCEQLVEVELCEGLDRIEGGAFRYCHSLRNLLIPTTAQVPSICFEGCYNLLMLFGSQEKIEWALKRRFVGLPIHELCYHQSHHPAELMIEQINDLIGTTSYHSGASLDIYHTTMDINQDCIGMTPLHILACSTTHNIDLYRIIIANQPGSLITEDKWGCLPILYTIWGNAPREILQFLIENQKASFPDIDLKWDKMLATLSRTGAPLDNIKRLLDTKRIFFPEQGVNWQTLAQELTVHCLFRCESFVSFGRLGDLSDEFFSMWESLMGAFRSSEAHQELVQSLLEIQRTFFPDQNHTDWKMMCEEFAQPLNGWWNSHSTVVSLKTFKFVMKCNIPERLSSIGIRKWRLDILNLVEDLAKEYKETLNEYKGIDGDPIHTKMITYEYEYRQLNEAAFLLELALWKLKVDDILGLNDQPRENVEITREQCRVRCGANIIIPRVLPFLIPFIDDKDESSESSSEWETAEEEDEWGTSEEEDEWGDDY